MQSKIIIEKIELSKKPAKVVFSFEDGSKAIFKGNTNNGTCEIDLYNGKRGTQAFNFILLHISIEDPKSSVFWFYIMDLVDDYKTLVYEG